MFKGKDRVYLIVALVCFVFLVVMTAYNREGEQPDMNNFAGNYYKGEYINARDSKAIYSALEGYAQVDETSCIIMPKTLDNTLKIYPCGQTLPWIASSAATTKKDAEALAKVAGYIQPYKDGDYIIAPGELVFTNSNVSSNATDRCITATIGKNYRISFLHIKEWWCHMESTVEYTHTEVVGAGSSNGTSSVLAGTIIGKAKAETQVCIEYSADGQNWAIVSFESYYGG